MSKNLREYTKHNPMGKRLSEFPGLMGFMQISTVDDVAITLHNNSGPGADEYVCYVYRRASFRFGHYFSSPTQAIAFYNSRVAEYMSVYKPLFDGCIIEDCEPVPAGDRRSVKKCKRGLPEG